MGRDRRGRPIGRPPTRIGRLLIVLRASVGLRDLSPDAPVKFREKISRQPVAGLSREEAACWAEEITGLRLSHDDIRRFETGGKRNPRRETLRDLLLTYGLSPDETEAVLADRHLDPAGGENPHLLASWRMRALAVGEFGPAIMGGLRIAGRVSSWVEVDKAASGGFGAGEVEIIVDDIEVQPPSAFVGQANAVKLQNDRRLAQGIRGWTDNPTLSLTAVTDHLIDDREERRRITVRACRSWYRYGVVAKQEAGAEWRWAALQAAETPLKPVPYLASGIGVCVNVICDDGRSVIIGHRSTDETFRKGEFDVAVVEGMRPTADVVDGRIDVASVVQRALIEELGLDRAVRGVDAGRHVRRIVVFELGCDLEYYQWNFLAFAEIGLDFETIYDGWQRAKDRKENQSIRAVPFDETVLVDLMVHQRIWSSGMACLSRTFDYW